MLHANAAHEANRLAIQTSDTTKLANKLEKINKQHTHTHTHVHLYRQSADLTLPVVVCLM